MKKLIALTAGLLVTLATTGCKGDRGDAGPAGGGRVVATIYCNGDVISSVAALNGLGVEYNAVVTAGGDVYATASIIDDVEQTSGTSFYASAEAGVSGASVNVTADYVGTGNGGLWTITLNRNTLITSVVYDDINLPAPFSMNFTASACTKRVF